MAKAIRREGSFALIGPAITGQVFLTFGDQVLRTFLNRDGILATKREAIAEFERICRKDFQCRHCGERQATGGRCHHCDTDDAQEFNAK